ncbi:LysR family transcriptional regulator [uncultured Martelella sp.]|uniref:LysR family transcriptional regulator n=1 Tax=uncultured Martelella sp. TaxID=392331 RepID=UPI0029C96A1D|nr:LysR family transcriptional regulator [uncultured Martelella sp.]
MEFRTLRAFVEVVRQGGFSQAAKTVFTTQSTVSKAVKQLEDEVGVALLERIGHRSVMTAAGEIVYARGVRLLADRADLLAELAEVRGLKRGVLRLGLPPVGSATLFAPLFAIYRQRYPGIDIDLDEHGSLDLEEKLRAGSIDFAGLQLPLAEDFEGQPVRSEPLVALLSSNHALAQRSAVSLEDLGDIPFIVFDDGFSLHRRLMRLARARGLDPVIAAQSSQVDFMVELVAAGLGVTFLPRTIAAHHAHPMVRRIAFEEPELNWSVAMAWRRGAYLSAAAAAWLDLVREIHGDAASPDASA